MQMIIQFALLGLGIGLSGYSAARPVEAASQSGRISVWLSQSGLLFFIGIALIIAAAVLMRRQAAALAQSPSEAAASDPSELLAALKEGAAEVLDGLRQDEPRTQPICDRIDGLRDGPIQALVECKDSMVARHGMLAYAQFISEVSAGERNLNRAWSTLVDGYPAEALSAAERANERLRSLELPTS
jgi:hypothetical protein